jgi:hypothetical protein
MITEEQIWNYLDGNLSQGERKAVDQAIATDKNAEVLFKEISALHLSLKKQPVFEPSTGFTERVMASLYMAPVYTQPAKSITGALWIFILPIAVSIVALVVYLIYNQVQITGTLPIHIPGLNIKHPVLYFGLIDILVLAYFLERLSDYRFNRKALFS